MYETRLWCLSFCVSQNNLKKHFKKACAKIATKFKHDVKKWRKIAHFYLVYEWIYNDSFTQNNVYLWYCIEPERVIIYLLSLRQARKSHNFFLSLILLKWWVNLSPVCCIHRAVFLSKFSEYLFPHISCLHSLALKLGFNWPSPSLRWYRD